MKSLRTKTAPGNLANGVAASSGDALDAIRAAMREHGVTECVGVIHAPECGRQLDEDSTCTCGAPETRITLEPS